MKNCELWKPTKVVRTENGFAPSPDTKHLSVSSRLIGSVLVRHYEHAIREHARGRLLDLGCGHAPYFEMYRESIEENICVDWENSPHRNELLDIQTDLNKPLPLDAASFDTVLLTDVLEHVARPHDLMLEIARVLRPGGKIIVGVPFFYWIHEGPHDFHRFTEFALREMCRLSHLDVISLEPYGGVPEIFADVTSKCIHGLGMTRLCRLHSAVSQALVRTAPMRAASKRTSRLFPLGYVMVATKETANGSGVPS